MKALQIALKDTLTRFRDWKALVGLLGAPLIVSALIGLAFGDLSFDDSSAPISDIIVIVVNEDEGELGQIYGDVLTSEDLDDLLAASEMSNLSAARAEIEQGNARAVIHIPANFSEALLPDADNPTSGIGKGSVQLFTDPSASISPFIMENLVEQITAGLNTGLMTGEISAEQISQYAQVLGPDMARLGEALAQEVNPEAFDFEGERISLEQVEVGEADEGFDAFSFFVPGMAVFFLMFSMIDGSRTILIEEKKGTLPRLMTMPTSTSEIILGKMSGTFLTGLLQFTILMVASYFIFGITWGNSLPALATVVVLTVFAASGLGALLASLAKNESQVSIISSAVALVFGALGGSFFPAENLSGVVDTLSRLTVNRWAMDGLTTLLIDNGDFADIVPQAIVLGGIGLATFSLALFAFRRRFVK